MIKNSFEKGPEGWCSYDYHWSVVAKGVNIFILTSWSSSGGVSDSGFIWCDETRWSGDTPEDPVSILPFIMYTNWVGLDPLDLREAEVSVFLRGDDLFLGGAQCYFWVVSAGGRWHFTSKPLTISEGEWAPEPNTMTLHNDESLWHLSWSGDPANPPALNDLLADARSYGISLAGFGQEPRGRFSMDEFEIRLAGPQENHRG
ncbi:MAG: hypothetical protein QF473_01090 [Planctomycetota bacterium]|nr:hypothetical protein [Planctomycetota bacterium]